MNKFFAVMIVMLTGMSVRLYSQNRTPIKGAASEIQLTPYKTTMLADGKDIAKVEIKIIDTDGKNVANENRTIDFHVKGDAHIISISGTAEKTLYKSDTMWTAEVLGSCVLLLQSGKTKSVVKFAAKSKGLWDGSTEIRTVFPSLAHKVTNRKYVPIKVADKIIGADISFLPELEAKGIKFSDNGVEKDVLEILKDHGFNYIRLRIFNEPANVKGYSPKEGFCDLEHTKQMAKRVKAAGMKLLLDFHYSDYWADPGQQFIPASWVGKSFNDLKGSVYNYTSTVIKELKDQRTLPDMVQIGNEINHGILWPIGGIENMDSLSQLLYEGLKAVKDVNVKTPTMLHIALGGQNSESRFFLDNMKERNVPFDIIGLSYYPKWHGTLADLKNNMADIANRYPQQVAVAEYTQLKKEVNDIAFTVPKSKGVGTFIWEPLSTWEMIFDKNGRTNEFINIYPEISKKYVRKK